RIADNLDVIPAVGEYLNGILSQFAVVIAGAAIANFCLVLYNSLMAAGNDSDDGDDSGDDDSDDGDDSGDDDSDDGDDEPEATEPEAPSWGGDNSGDDDSDDGDDEAEDTRNV
ncbi:MAG: hypothetical protein VYA31_01205, partial [Gemmatimonadota bacterium]|nr:hypothetical protein [Gemmatimonadota bacterium]